MEHLHIFMCPLRQVLYLYEMTSSLPQLGGFFMKGGLEITIEDNKNWDAKVLNITCYLHVESVWAGR